MLEAAIVCSHITQSEWLMLRDVLELLDRAWDDESLLGLGLAESLRSLIYADGVCLGCTELATAQHRVILFDHCPESYRKAQADLEQKVSLLTKALADSDRSQVDDQRMNGNPYSDLAEPLLLGSALGAIIPVWPVSSVWSVSLLLDLLVTPAQEKEFSDSHQEIFELLMPHIAEAFRRVWVRPNT